MCIRDSIYTKEVFISKAAEAAKSSYRDIKEIYLENNATIKDSPLDWESIDTLNKIKDLFKVANRKTAVLLLAKHIDEMSIRDSYNANNNTSTCKI